MFTRVHTGMVFTHEALSRGIDIDLPGHAPFGSCNYGHRGRRARYVEVVQHHPEKGLEEFRAAQRAARRHTHFQSAAEIEGIGQAGVQRRAVQCLEHLRVGRAATTGKRHLAAKQVHFSPHCIAHHDAVHGPGVILNQFQRVRADQEFDGPFASQIKDLRQQDFQDRDSILLRPLVAPRRVGFMPSGYDRMAIQGRESLFAQPIHRPGRFPDENADELGIDLPLADAHDVVKVRFGRILNALLGLESRPCGCNLAKGPVQRSTQAVRLFHNEHPGALLGGEDRARESRRSPTNHDQVPGFAGRPADARHQCHCRRSAGAGEQFPLVQPKYRSFRRGIKVNPAH